MESIQLAQMLADLSDLNAAQEAQAAVALVNANKTLPSQPSTPTVDTSKAAPADAQAHLHPPTRPGQRHHQRTGSAGSVGSGTPSSFMSRTASPATFDKYGRKLLTPPTTRSNSSYGSVPGTPRRDTEMSAEDDLDQANSLMALYKIRAKLKEQDNQSLHKLRDKITALQMSRSQSDKGLSSYGQQSHLNPQHHHAGPGAPGMPGSPTGTEAKVKFTYPRS